MIVQLTCIKVLPSSRNKRNGTSESMGLRSSDQPPLVKNWDPVTAQIGVWTPAREETVVINLESINTWSCCDGIDFFNYPPPTVAVTFIGLHYLIMIIWSEFQCHLNNCVSTKSAALPPPFQLKNKQFIINQRSTFPHLLSLDCVCFSRRLAMWYKKNGNLPFKCLL